MKGINKVKVIYKIMLNKLYKHYNGDIRLLTLVINEMKAPDNELKQEFIEYIKKYKERKYEN